MCPSISTDATGGVSGDPQSGFPNVANEADSRIIRLGTAFAVFALSIGLLFAAQGIESRVDTGGLTPKWWPTILASSMLVLSLVLTVEASRKSSKGIDAKPATRLGLLRCLLTVVLSAGFIAIWSFIPFIVASVIYLFGLVFIFGGRSSYALLFVPVCITLGIYISFGILLRVPL